MISMKFRHHNIYNECYIQNVVYKILMNLDVNESAGAIKTGKPALFENNACLTFLYKLSHN
jgi:hypothetical protein